MAKAKSLQNREQYYHNQMQLLQKADIKSNLQNLGLSVNNDGRVCLRFFAQDYLVGPDGVEVLGPLPVTSDHKSVIAHYVMSQGQGLLKGEYVPIGRLTGMVETGKNPSDNLVLPLTEKFGYKYPAFCKAAEKVGGAYEGKTPAGAECWMFWPFPNLPMQVAFFEADDEFPAEVRVLFDEASTKFVSYECLELLEIVLVLELLRAADMIGCGGSCDHEHHCDDSACECGCDK